MVKVKLKLFFVADQRTLKIILNIKSQGGLLLSGVPYQQEVVYRILTAEVDGDYAAGLLELGYEPSGKILHISINFISYSINYNFPEFFLKSPYS